MNKFLALFIFPAVLIMGLSACSKKAPPPPHLRSDLVLEILSDLEFEDYSNALIRIRRLRTLEPSNTFLPQLEEITEANQVIAKAEKQLLHNDRKGAEKTIKDAAAQQGQSKYLSDALHSIHDFSQLEQLVPILRNPRSADELELAAKKFLIFAKRVDKSGKLGFFAAKKMAKLPYLRSREIYISILDLEMDEYNAILIEDSISETLSAQKKLYSEQTTEKAVYSTKRR